ncbi:MAG: pyrroline-5-carboxylate reductase [Neisseriaceae bacterium]|nr:pyrroline-5-carboxylate reductase [Neisseriaceae bacterium]MBP6863147.1 pyrroline-5-carboxylate reductase [Neisseriaceae bacterium]
MIYFLGGGNMASAIIAGLVNGPHPVGVIDTNADKLKDLAARYGVETFQQVPTLSAADVLVLAVKPQDLQASCATIEPNGALVVSIAAGVDLATLSQYLRGHQRLIRIMPNTPAQVGLGISGVYAPAQVSVADRDLAERIMAAVGEVVRLADEDQIHAITSISGSGPAYVFYLMNALAEAAAAQGFDADTARQLSLATFKGAVALAEQSGEEFSLLQQKVTSKGGTTHEAIVTFTQKGVAEGIKAGVDACKQRSEAMQAAFKQG